MKAEQDTMRSSVDLEETHHFTKPARTPGTPRNLDQFPV